MKKRLFLLSTVILTALSVLQAGPVAAAATPAKTAEPKPILEMHIHPPKTAEKIEQERWAYLMNSDRGLFLYDNTALSVDPQDKEDVLMLVRTIYKDNKIIEKLNTQFADKLASGDAVSGTDIALKINVRHKTYALQDTKLLSKKGKLLYEKKQTAKFVPIKTQTLMDTAYLVAKAYLQTV